MEIEFFYFEALLEEDEDSDGHSGNRLLQASRRTNAEFEVQ